MGRAGQDSDEEELSSVQGRIEFCLGRDDDPAESLWVTISKQTNRGDTVMGICYVFPGQKEEIDKSFFRKMEEASRSQALVLIGDFNHPSICWRYNTVRHKQSRSFLECFDSFLTGV